jgi:8-oxo-dGTP pyrophosphatase MutT (NUDIX family)
MFLPPKFGLFYFSHMLKRGNKAVPIKLFACTVVTHPETREFLIVQETAQKAFTWYFPGGKVDRGETFCEGAAREAKEEAGLEIALEGLLRVEHNSDWSELRLLFVGCPTEPDAKPKTTSDVHSERASWVTVDKLSVLQVRDEDVEPAYRARHNGAPIYPLDLLCEIPQSRFGEERCADPYELIVRISIFSEDLTSVLCFQKQQYSPCLWLRREEAFEAGTTTLIRTLEAETGLKLALKGIMQITHKPLAHPQDAGKFEVHYAAIAREFSLEEGEGWKLFPVSEISGSAQVRVFSPKIIAKSIYEEWYI